MMLSLQRLYQLFTDEINWVKFITISKATSEKKLKNQPPASSPRQRIQTILLKI